MENEFIVGIDVSKDKLDICVIKSASSPALEEKVIPNTASGIEKYLRQASSRYGIENLVVCLEHTGHYGLLLCSLLERHSVNYSLVPAMEIKKTQGMARGKTDRLDAHRIAQYAFRYRERLPPSRLPAKDLILIGELVSLREHYIRISIQLQNALKAHKVAGQTVDNTIVMTSIGDMLANTKREISELEAKMRELIEANTEIRDNFRLLNTVKGIGPITAIMLIMTTRNFAGIREARKYNSYAGIAPFRNESGKTDKGSRVSHMANKRIKTLLHNGACSAVNHDNELKIYYNRKLDEGKNKMSVLNAVACKLVYRAFAVIKRQSPYVNLVQYKVA